MKESKVKVIKTKKKKTTKAIVKAHPKAEAKSLASAFFRDNEIVDFSKIAEYPKLCVIQTTPKDYIKTRSIKTRGRAVMLPYVDHYYAERALNFVFNFRVSNEIISHEFKEYSQEYMDYSKRDKPVKRERDVTEAECMVKFTFVTNEGKEIIRTVYSSHKGYPNPATTRGDILKSAISKSWTAVARTFGIGADVVGRETKAYKKAEVEDKKGHAKPVKKSFVKNKPNY